MTQKIFVVICKGNFERYVVLGKKKKSKDYITALDSSSIGNK